MHHRTFLTASILPLVVACSCWIAPARAQDEDKAFFEQFQKTFELEAHVAAKDFVPAAAMHGTLHSVHPAAFNDGLNNIYFLDSPEGLVEVSGTPALLVRIREIYAIDYLRGL